jgi:hypothetical protein
MTSVTRDPEDVAVRTLHAASQGHVMEVMSRLIVERMHVVLGALECGDTFEGPLQNLMVGLGDEERIFFQTRLDRLRDALLERDIYALWCGKLPKRALPNSTKPRGRRVYRSIEDFRAGRPSAEIPIPRRAPTPRELEDVLDYIANTLDGDDS